MAAESATAAVGRQKKLQEKSTPRWDYPIEYFHVGKIGAIQGGSRRIRIPLAKTNTTTTDAPGRASENPALCAPRSAGKKRADLRMRKHEAGL